MKFKSIIATLGVTAAFLTFAGTNASANTNYTIQNGDSLWSISQAYGVTVPDLVSANGMSGINDFIYPGETLTIPTNATTYTAPTYSAPVQTAPVTTTVAPTQTGSTQSYVLSQMESRTGVSAATWNNIITRESNWQSGVVNSTSGAYGLFQNMHISGGSVQEQVDAAVSLYNQQGMGAWSLTNY